MSGRGAGQQRGQEAAALHDDGGEIQHEVGEAVQPALLNTVSSGAGLGQEPAGENIFVALRKTSAELTRAMTSAQRSVKPWPGARYQNKS